MYAIELATAADQCGDSLARSLPPTLRSALSSRLAGVPPAELDVLRVAAALGPSSVAAIERVAGVTDSVAACRRRGVDAGSSTSRATMTCASPTRCSPRWCSPASIPVERQTLHARLADAVDDPDDRARHLALSCAEPDAGVAAELDAAATRAARRAHRRSPPSSPGTAFASLPPDDVEARVRRAFATVLHRAAAGDKTAALAEADQLVARLPWGPVRAEAIALRVAIDFADGDRFLEQALAEVGDDDLLRGPDHRAAGMDGRRLPRRAGTRPRPLRGGVASSPNDSASLRWRCSPPARWRWLPC